jgi:hypothetical protein
MKLPNLLLLVVDPLMVEEEDLAVAMVVERDFALFAVGPIILLKHVF